VPLIEAFGPSGAAGASAIGYACGALVAWALFVRLTRVRDARPAGTVAA
jgi:Na+-driven multidrug efflux pump